MLKFSKTNKKLMILLEKLINLKSVHSLVITWLHNCSTIYSLISIIPTKAGILHEMTTCYVYDFQPVVYISHSAPGDSQF